MAEKSETTAPFLAMADPKYVWTSALLVKWLKYCQEIDWDYVDHKREDLTKNNWTYPNLTGSTVT